LIQEPFSPNSLNPSQKPWQQQ